MTNNNQRVNYIDFIKGAAIMAVVFGHILCFEGFPKLLPIKTFFAYAWHVPVFFMVAGFFLKDVTVDNFVPFVKKKIKQLYLLALYFYLPATLLHNVFCRIGWYNPDIACDGRVTPFEGFGEFAKQTILTICCAGREPIAGAMWFVYVLLFAMIGYGFISLTVNKLGGGVNKPLIFFVLAVASGILANQMGIMIKRCSNVFTAMLLIYIGQYLYQQIKMKFDNGVIAAICALMLYEVSVTSDGVALNSNHFQGIAALLAGSFSALYILGYIGQKFEGSCVERFVKYCGKESFYIMALHFVGFKIATYFLSTLGLPHCQLGELTPTLGNNVLLVAVYFSFGVIFPLTFMWAFRKVKKVLSVFDV